MLQQQLLCDTKIRNYVYCFRFGFKTPDFNGFQSYGSFAVCIVVYCMHVGRSKNGRWKV